MAGKVLQYTITGVDNNASQTLKNVGLSAQQSAAKIKELQQAQQAQSEGGEGGGLKGVADALGSRRALSRIFAGGIAGLIGSELEKVTGKAVELSNEFRRGQIDASGLAVKIGESLPIIGGFVSAGQSIRELFTHEQAQIDEINEKLKLQNQLIDFQKAGLEQIKKVRQETADDIEKSKDAFGAIGKTGYDKDQYDTAIGAKNDVEAVYKKRQQALDENTKREQKAIDDLRAAQGDPKRILPEKDYQDQIKSIQRSAAKERQQISNEFDGDIGQAKATAAQKVSYQDAKAHLDAVNKMADNQRALTDIQVNATADRLRSQGRDLDAELLLLRQSGEDKKAELQKQFKEQMEAAPPDLRAQLQAQANQQMQAVDQQTSDKSRELIKKRSDQIQKDLVKQQEQNLSATAETSTNFFQQQAAKKQLEALKLKEQFRDQGKQLAELLNDPAATAQQKQQALQQFKAFSQNGGKLYDQATLGNQQPLNHLAQLQESNTLHGYNAAAKERGDIEIAKQTAKNTSDAVKLQQDFNDKFTQFLQIYQRSAGSSTNAQPLEGIFDF